jgi:hypothetical protein
LLPIELWLGTRFGDFCGFGQGLQQFGAEVGGGAGFVARELSGHQLHGVGKVVEVKVVHEDVEQLAGAVEEEALDDAAGKFLQARQRHIAGGRVVGDEEWSGVDHTEGAAVIRLPVKADWFGATQWQFYSLVFRYIPGTVVASAGPPDGAERQSAVGGRYESAFRSPAVLLQHNLLK